ncbi:melanin-concentrating hormone receptor 2 isoform X6 [Cygnus atratus]|uniref:melanin-concentrating hormone receptor 2 isoform X6 n=1 Tax=Cygnus atratus TaxID=8868 RepID=UPI0021B7892F|nr:melanin-concentrating hormone receptor 2 isoform X6 [Cygnus atratus]
MREIRKITSLARRALLINRSWNGKHHYQVISAAETIILPSLIGIICSTGLVGNILIVFTIIRYNTSIPRQRVMKLTKMVLALVIVFVWELPEASPEVHKHGSKDGRTGCQPH